MSLDPQDESLASFAERAEDLMQFAWIFRYPGELEAPAQQVAAAALPLTRVVYEAVLSRLPKEVAP